MLVSAIHQYESATGIHVSPPSWASILFSFLNWVICLCCYRVCESYYILWIKFSYHLWFADVFSSHGLSFHFFDSISRSTKLLNFDQVYFILSFVTVVLVEISRQEYWSGLPLPSPGDLPDPGSNLAGSLALQAHSLPSEPPVKSTSEKLLLNPRSWQHAEFYSFNSYI